jgi:hypothetical protein
MIDNPLSTKASGLDGGKIIKSKIYEGSRVCKERGCDTSLSIYNPGSFCWLHRDGLNT